MASISITVPDAVLTRVAEAFATHFNYAQNKQETETKNQFAKRMLADMAKRLVVAEEAKVAANTAFDTTTSAANTDIAIT